MNYGPLEAQDFPITHVGPAVYRRSASSPIFVAPTEALASDLVKRLNEHETLRQTALRMVGPGYAGFSVGAIYGGGPGTGAISITTGAQIYAAASAPPEVGETSSAPVCKGSLSLASGCLKCARCRHPMAIMNGGGYAVDRGEACWIASGGQPPESETFKPTPQGELEAWRWCSERYFKRFGHAPWNARS